MPDAPGPRSPYLSRRRLLALGGFTTVAMATGLCRAPMASATTAQVSLDFEDGGLGAPITRHIGARVAGAYAHSGRYGCRLDPTTTSDGVACLAVDRSGFALGKRYATFSMYFRLVTLPDRSDTYMNLFEIGNTCRDSTKGQFTVFFRNDRLTCDFNYSETMDIAPVPTDGDWHLIEVVVDFGATTYTASVSYDGAAAQTFSSADNKTAASVRALWIHYSSTAVDYTMDVDDIRMATSDTRPGFFQPPTLAAGGALTFTESFEGGAVGTRPTSANTSYDQSIGDKGDNSGRVAAAFAGHGFRGQCVRFSMTSLGTGAFGFLGKRVGAQQALFFRRYYRLDVLPTYRTAVLLYKWGGSGNGQVGGTHNGSLAFGGSGQAHKFVLVDGNTNSTRSMATVPLGEWFRVETRVDFTSGSGVQTARLFLGGNVDGTTPDETLRAQLSGTYTDYVEDGILNNPNVMLHLDIDEAANDGDWPGPVG